MSMNTREIPGWKRWKAISPTRRYFICVLIGVLIGAMITLVSASRANAFDSTDGGDLMSFDAATDAAFSQSTEDVVGTASPGLTQPGNPEGFVANFKAGAYGHTRANIPYSAAFRAFFLAERKRIAVATGNVPACVSTSSTGGSYQCTWDKFQAHDTCIVGQQPNTFTTNSCTFQGKTVCWDCLVASPYWTQRGDLQNKWEARIIVCGTVGIIGFFLKGKVVGQLLGSGSGMCLAGKVVN